MLDILAIVLLLRSPAWLLATLGAGWIMFWIVRAIGWRWALAIPGLLLMAAAFASRSFITDHETRQQVFWWLYVIGGVLTIPVNIEIDRQARAARKARKEWEAKRDVIRPISPHWVAAVLVVAVIPVSAVGVVAMAKFVSNTPVALFGVAPGFAILAWSAVHERKRLRSIPKGVIGQTKEGLYVYDLNALKRERQGS